MQPLVDSGKRQNRLFVDLCCFKSTAMILIIQCHRMEDWQERQVSNPRHIVTYCTVLFRFGYESCLFGKHNCSVSFRFVPFLGKVIGSTLGPQVGFPLDQVCIG